MHFFLQASRKKLQEVVLALESVYVCSDKRANLSCTIPEKFSAANPFLNVTVVISCNLPSTNQYWQREWVHLKADWRHIDLVKIEQQLSPPDVHATPDCFSLQAKPADGMWELKWQQSGQVHTLNSWQAWSGHGIASLPSLADCNPAQFRHRAWPRAFPHSGCFRGVKRTDTGRIVYSIDLLNGTLSHSSEWF